MIQVYSYSSAMKIYDMLQENKIVTLEVYLGEYVDKPANQYLINYTTVQEYPGRERPSIQSLFERNIITTQQAVTEFKNFIEAMHTNSVLKFKMSYSILKPEIVVNKLFAQADPEVKHPNPSKILDDLETAFTELGIHRVKVPCYEKVQQQGQKRPKYQQLDICGLINILRNVEVHDDTG